MKLSGVKIPISNRPKPLNFEGLRLRRSENKGTYRIFHTSFEDMFIHIEGGVVWVEMERDGASLGGHRTALITNEAEVKEIRASFVEMERRLK